MVPRHSTLFMRKGAGRVLDSCLWGGVMSLKIRAMRLCQGFLFE